MAVICLPVFTSNAEDAPDIEEMANKLQDMQDKGETLAADEMSFTTEKTKGVYTERMGGVIRDMIDLGYI